MREEGGTNKGVGCVALLVFVGIYRAGRVVIDYKVC